MSCSPNGFACYLAALDDWPFEVAVDLELGERAPLSGHPFRVHLRMELDHPTADGLCGRDEREALAREEALIFASQTARGWIPVARVTHRGARTLVFHAPSDDQAAIAAATALVRRRRPGLQVVHDPAWTEFRAVLLPSPEMQHQIEDRRTIREYERSGAEISETHRLTARFRTPRVADARRLAEGLERKGFAVRVLAPEEPRPQEGGWVFADADTPLFPALLDDFRHAWLELAASSGADYVGWSAKPLSAC